MRLLWRRAVHPSLTYPGHAGPRQKEVTVVKFVRMYLLILTILLPTHAHAWSARKADRPVKHAVHHDKIARNPHRQPTATTLPVDGKIPQSPKLALQLLKHQVALRQMDEALKIAQALLVAKQTPVEVLAEAATALGSGNDYPVQEKLWQRAHEKGRAHPALLRQIVEGYVDSLLTMGEAQKARKILATAIAHTQTGARRSLLDRLVAAARLDGQLPETIRELQALRDPDAAVLAAQLLEEEGQTDEAEQELAVAWQKFPGNRALQAAYQALLVRQGRREELTRMVQQVVRLAPADPLPWLAVLDADIAARDIDAARRLIDDLARKNPRHDVLLEALIDREQRLGDTPVRVKALYDLLLAAAPRESQYIEAYAEWLLNQPPRPGPGKDPDEAALTVLARLSQPSGPKMDAAAGLEKAAAILLNHNRFLAARKMALTLEQKKPGDLRVLRLLAMLDEREGHLNEAIARWTKLTELPENPQQAERQKAAEARLALAALLRRTAQVAETALALRQRVETGKATRAEVLLWLDVQGQLDDGRDALNDAEWLRIAELGRKKYADDDEIGLAVATGVLTRGRLIEALPAIEALTQHDRDAAVPLVGQAVELALARGDAGTSQKLENLLLEGGETPQQSVLLRLGDLHLRHGDNAGATALYRRATAVNTRDTRAIGRLATLFRLSGALEEEDHVLREIVARATDGDEIDAAGQRLLAVALGAGRLGELVRWLDTILPQHTRRELVERLRMTGYDLWLRANPLEQALGHAGPEPMASGVGDALSSGDLGLQIKALRQLAQLHRSLPPALAMQLLAKQNPALRRDVTLLLGASGTENATKLIVSAMDGHDSQLDGGLDQDEEVRFAQLAALSQLPPTPGVERPLDDMMRRDETVAAAALVMARVAGPSPALNRLGDVLVAGRRDVQPYALLALGALAGRFGHEPQAREALERILLFSPARPGRTDYPRQAAALWALAATGQAVGVQEVWKAALVAEERPLRQMAVRLMAQKQPPTLVFPEIRVAEGDSGQDLKNRILRGTLLPWLSADNVTLAQALAQVDADLARAATAEFAANSEPLALYSWCQTWLDVDGKSLAGPNVQALCKVSQ